MMSERKWFLIGATAVLVTIFGASFFYVRAMQQQSASLIRSHTATARARLQECASLTSSGLLHDEIRICGTAASASKEAALVLRRSHQQTDRLSHSAFLGFRFAIRGPDPREAALVETLSAFSAQVEPIALWWTTARVRLLALSAYNSEADLRDRSSSENPQDFVRRLYLAKTALLLCESSLSEPEALLLGVRVAGIHASIALIDQLIGATARRDSAASNSLRSQYITSMQALSSAANASVKNAEQSIRRLSLPIRAASALEALR